jgi:hypothetical protein
VAVGGYLFVLVIMMVFLAFVLIGFRFWIGGYLKDKHFNTWVSLGTPSVLNNSALNIFRVMRFVAWREYRALKDPFLNSRADLARILFLVFVALFASIVILSDVVGGKS